MIRGRQWWSIPISEEVLTRLVICSRDSLFAPAAEQMELRYESARGVGAEKLRDKSRSNAIRHHLGQHGRCDLEGCLTVPSNLLATVNEVIDWARAAACGVSAASSTSSVHVYAAHAQDR